jgi:hypothetical protein
MAERPKRVAAFKLKKIMYFIMDDFLVILPNDNKFLS